MSYSLIDNKHEMVKELVQDEHICNILVTLGWVMPKNRKDMPNEINLLHERIFDLEIALSKMITLNTSTTEMLEKEMVSNHIRIKKISELMKKLKETK